MENKFKEAGLLKQRGISGLPNEELQPNDLLHTIIEKLKDNDDALGYITAKEMFERSDEKQTFSIGQSVRPQNVETHGLNPQEVEFYNTL